MLLAENFGLPDADFHKIENSKIKMVLIIFVDKLFNFLILIT